MSCRGDPKPGSIVGAERQVRCRDALGHGGCQSAQLFAAEDVPEGNDQPLLITGLKGQRYVREVDLLLSTRFDQPQARVTSSKPGQDTLRPIRRITSLSQRQLSWISPSGT